MEVNRSAITGQFVSDEETKANPETTVTETIEKAPEMSSWLQEWMRTGLEIERAARLDPSLDLDPTLAGYWIDSLAISAMKHTQVLKRVDKGLGPHVEG